MTADVTIERAATADGPAILALLCSNALPVDGVLDHLHNALVARCQGRVIGSAALEVYDDGALLRSVAVEATHRGRGIGQQLTTAALELAGTLDVPAAFLLTTSADGFFQRFAFKRIRRDDVPPGVRASAEFRSACPSTATVMMKAL